MPRFREKVGYKKPPTHTQFKKGVSGNAKGRPKGSENTMKMLNKILNEKVIAKDQFGKIRKMTKLEAIFQNLMTASMKGDHKAIKTLFDLLKRTGVFNEPEEPNRSGGGGVIVVPASLSMEEFIAKYDIKTSTEIKEEQNRQVT